MNTTTSLLSGALFMAMMSTSAHAQVNPVFPVGQGNSQTVNIVQWAPENLPKVYERSEQLPLSEQEVIELSKAGFGPQDVITMIEQRRCTADVSAKGMIRLKKAGVAPKVIAAMSRHALRPNRGVNFEVTVDFERQGNQARNSHLYAFVTDGAFTRVFTADLSSLLAMQSGTARLNQSDRMVTRQVRRVRLQGTLPLTTYGKHKVMIVSSAHPGLIHPSELTARERKRAKVYTIDYPRSSLNSVCRMNISYQRDKMIRDRWHLQGSRFECEWN